MRQVDAIRRQNIATIAHGIGIGMAESSDHQRAVDELELTDTAEVSKKHRSEATWNMLKVLGGGRGV